MRKFFKVSLVITLSLAVVFFTILAIIFILPPSVKLDESKLIKAENCTAIYDKDLNVINRTTALNSSVKIEDLSNDTKNAFIAIEDKNFYTHKGIDIKRILSATLKNLSKFSYTQGASTISQQLIKNTHLTSKKNLKRKIDEIKLALQLERNYTKDQILEMYLNTIYFGENCYGISQASNVYFNKQANELSLSESATLAGIIVAPSRLNPIANAQACKERRNLVISRMSKLNLITSQDEILAKNQDIIIDYKKYYDTDKGYIQAVISELSELSKEKPYTFKNCKIYTQFCPKTQKILGESRPKIESDYQAIVIDNSSSQVVAYYSTCGEISRSPASTVKPWLVYAPAIEEGVINQYTVIDDTKTDFNGYSPTNYGEKYYGKVSAKKALSLSLNIPAIKVLNVLGVDKAKNYAKNLNIDVKSDGLGIALGAINNDIKLKEIASCYTAFANFGEYKKPKFISYICDENGNTIYKNQEVTKKAYSIGTTSIVNEMLKETVNSGTAKTLRSLNCDIYAKTGTNGFSNGNLDAYCIAYTSQNTFATWLGNKDNSLLDNSVTGSSYPTSSVREIVEKYYSDKKPPAIESKEIVSLKIDKESYENNGELLISDDNAPSDSYFIGNFTKSNQPNNKCTKFKKPKIIDYSVDFKDNTIYITYNLQTNVNVEIEKHSNGKSELVYSGNANYSEKLSNDGLYYYTLTPYITNKKQIIYGDKIELPTINIQDSSNKIIIKPNDWWTK